MCQIKVTAILLAFLALFSTDAFATPKKTKVGDDQYFNVTVTINLTKKKTQDRVVACYNAKPGKISKEKKKLFFTSYRDVLKTLSQRAKSTRGKALISLKKEVGIVKQLSKTTVCSTTTPPGNTPPGEIPPTAAPTPLPDFLSLEAYSGPFGRAEARILFGRFGFGANPAEIDQAVAEGLYTTIDRLMTWQDDSVLNAYLADYACDGKLAPDPLNKVCNPDNLNDFYDPALRTELYARSLHLSQRFFIKFYHWLHDERAAAVTRGVNNCNKHALKEHHELLMRTARSGDFLQFARDYNSDLLGHIIALNGQSNQKNSVNQDYPREFWELLTIGPRNLKGVPNYNDDDIAEVARAFTGWKVEQYTISGNQICLAAFVPDLHDLGPKTIFQGTPYQTVVYDAEDVLKATFGRSDNAVAMNLAKELWEHYLNPYYSEESVAALAQIIRDNNYKLLPAMRTMMASRALFAARSKKSLIKQPIELLLGFRIQSQIPVLPSQNTSEYTKIDEILNNNIAQQPLNPPTVFGTYEDKLAGEAYVIDWRNQTYKIAIDQAEAILLEKHGFVFREFYMNNLPQSTSPADTLVSTLSDRFDLEFTADQRSKMVEFLNFDLTPCYQGEPNCPNIPKAGYKMVRNVWDPDPGSSDRHKNRAKALIAILAQLPTYRLK